MCIIYVQHPQETDVILYSTLHRWLSRDRELERRFCLICWQIEHCSRIFPPDNNKGEEKNTCILNSFNADNTILCLTEINDDLGRFMYKCESYMWHMQYCRGGHSLFFHSVQLLRRKQVAKLKHDKDIYPYSLCLCPRVGCRVDSVPRKLYVVLSYEVLL